MKRNSKPNQLTCLEGLSLVHMEVNLSFGVEINIAGRCALLLENLEDISWKSATMEKKRSAVNLSILYTFVHTFLLNEHRRILHLAITIFKSQEKKRRSRFWLTLSHESTYQFSSMLLLHSL